MNRVVITVDMDKKCAECGKGGACGNGLCLKCATKAIGDKPMRSPEGKAAQARYKAILADIPTTRG